jgi:radical SAM superfamily enzyme
MGLPGETYEEQLSEASIISHLPITFLKLHQLQIVRGSAFADIYSHAPEYFSLWTADEYIEFCINFAERLSPHIVIERFISQAPRDMVIAPSWDIKNFEFVHKIERRLKERNTWQGRLYKTTCQRENI